MIFHENCLLADDSHEKSYLIFFKNWERCVSSFAVVIGALSFKIWSHIFFHVSWGWIWTCMYNKIRLKQPLNKNTKIWSVFKTDYNLMQVKGIAECSKGSILQCFQPSLSYHLSLRPLFCLFLNDCLRQVLLCK